MLLVGINIFIKAVVSNEDLQYANVKLEVTAQKAFHKM